MARISLLVLLALGAFATPTHTIPDSLFSNNYAGFKGFVAGFMNGFTGTTYELSDDCLSTDMQTKLDEHVIGLFSYLVRGHLDEFYEQFGVIFTDFESISSDCGLNIVQNSFEYDLKKKGIVHFVMNTLWHFFDIEADVLDMLGDVVTLNFESAGTRLGELVAFVVEPMPSKMMKRLRTNPENVADILEGFFTGIQTDPANPTACAGDFRNATVLVSGALNSLEGAFNGTITDLMTFIEDV
jgi:hypothetical protein